VKQTLRLEDVARRAGVSSITVSRALGNPDRVSARTRDHVRRIAEEMGYVTNRTASSLVSKCSWIVGAVVPTMANPIHSEALQGMADQLGPAGYQILLGTTGYSAAEEFRLVQTFIGHRVDALVLTGGDHLPATSELLHRSGVPTIETFEFIERPIDLNVGSSQRDAGHALALYLLSRGRRKLAFVGHSDVDDTRISERRSGLAAACREHGAAEPHIYATASNPGSGGGGEIIGSILQQTPDVDAVVFAGHQIAVGAIRHSADIGIDVPGRVAIAAFGESPMARWIRPSLTTVHFPVKEMGTETGRLILARLAGRTFENRSIRLGFEILARESA